MNTSWDNFGAEPHGKTRYEEAVAALLRAHLLLFFGLLLLLRKFFLHVISSGFLKVEREGLPGAVQFAANGVGRLVR